MSQQETTDLNTLPWTTTPPWCGYPDPAAPMVGCWSLLGGKIVTRKDCGDCECATQEGASDAG